MIKWQELFKDYSKHDVDYSMTAMLSVLKIVIMYAKLCDDKERFINVMTNTLNSIEHDLEEVRKNEKETI